MKPLILGLHAKPRSGKDTLALLFQDKSGSHVVVVAYADGIYRDLCAGYGVERWDFSSTQSKTVAQDRYALMHCGIPEFRAWCREEGLDLLQPRTSREVMQKYGTDYMHRIDPLHWVTDTIDRIKLQIAGKPDSHVIVTDVRHAGTEISPLRVLASQTGRSYHTVEIVKPWGTDHTTAHDSDKRIPPGLIDLTITNHEGQPSKMLQQLHSYLQTKATK